jgi:hypothetical protein
LKYRVSEWKPCEVLQNKTKELYNEIVKEGNKENEKCMSMFSTTITIYNPISVREKNCIQ